MKPSDLAIILNVNTGQIYQWNKKGISANNRHFPAIKRMFPEIVPKEVTIKGDGSEDLRTFSGRNKKELHLTDTDLPSYVEPEFVSTLFPNIKFRKRR